MQLPEVLRIRSFRDLWLGQAISQLGDSLYYVAFMYMAERLTGSLAVVGYVGAMEAVPFLLFGAYAGVVADRIDRRRILLLSDLVCATALLLYAAYVFFNPTPPIWTLLVMPFILSSVRCFFMPAKTAAIPSLVPSGLLMRANGLSAATMNIVFMIGLALSAGVIAQIYAWNTKLFFMSVLTLNGLSFLGSAVYIARLPGLQPERADGPDTHPLDDFVSGLRFIGRRHDLVVLAALQTAFRLGVAPFFVVYVAANKQWYGGAPSTLSWLEFSFFVGMILGSVWVTKVQPRRPMMFFMFGLAGVGVTIAGMAFCENSIFAFLFLNFAAGIIVPFADVPTITYLQASVANEFRGRVNAVREMLASGIMPIGMLLAGTMVQALGLVTAFLIMGVGMMVACLSGFLDRRFREVEMPAEVSDPAPIEDRQEAGAVA